MLPFHNMCCDQPLPVEVEHILTARARHLDSAARFARLQQQMHFRIVAQRLKMSHTLHRLCDRLFVYNVALSKDNHNTKPFFDQLRQDFDLHLSHHLGMDFLQLLIPEDMKLWIFLLKLL